MSRFRLLHLVALLMVGFTASAPVSAAEDDAGDAKEPTAVEQIRADAAKLTPMVKSDLGRAFLAASAQLPSIAPRTVYIDKAAGRVYTAERAATLSPSERDALDAKVLDESFYYNTRYGSPLIYVRPLDLVAAAGFDSFEGKRVLDFGYGMIGQLRMMAGLGGDVVGTEVYALLEALYSEPADQGIIKNANGRDGQVTLIQGRWPADNGIRQAAGAGFDLFISKNTLKRGYIHPEREVDERMTIQLGVSDDEFVKALYDAMNPGGLVMIYNICPAQNPPGQPYIPWADGRCPFNRSLLERAGFEVLAFDKEDSEAIYDIWEALGYDQGEPREKLKTSLFAHYTLLRRPR